MLTGLNQRDEDCFFFFQAEDGIRDHCVTGVQTCALPICCSRQLCDSMSMIAANLLKGTIPLTDHQFLVLKRQIGRASCRERV